MAVIDKSFKELVNKIITEGYTYEDPYRKGVNRLEIGSYEFRHDMTKGFPALTTKKLYWKGIVTELIWFLRGDTNIKYLVENNVHIWDKDAYKFYVRRCIEDNWLPALSEEAWMTEVLKTPKEWESHIQSRFCDGNLGKVYGGQWRNWEKFVGNDGNALFYENVDQIKALVEGMITRPLATDLIVNAWNPGDNKRVALPPCHYGFQILGRPLSKVERMEGSMWSYQQEPTDTELDLEGLPKYGFTLKWNQRSVDTFLGLPFNIASYALLAEILGKITNMVPLEIIGNLSKVHLYDNALEKVNEQMSRDVDKYENIELKIKDRPEYGRLLKGNCALDNFLSNLEPSDFKLNNYKSFPPLKVEMLARD